MDLKKYFIKSKKGQAFESFRLLIAFILALAVLVIIFTMIRSTRKKAIFLSHQKFKEGMISATKSVGASSKDPFYIKNLQLSGVISANTIESYTGIPSSCLYFVHGPGFEDRSDSNTLYVEDTYQKIDAQIFCDFLSNRDPDGEVEDGDSLDHIRTQVKNDCDHKTYCVIAMNKKINLT